MRVRGLVMATAVLAALAPGAVLQGAAAAESVSTACPADVPSAGFVDVPAGDVHAASIDCVVWWGISRGVDATRYDPAPAVTRGQAAALLATTVRRTGGALAASPGDLLAGDEHSVHHFAINRMVEAGIVSGTGGQFRPDEPVTRGQLATLVVKAFEQRTGVELPAGPDAFADDRRSVHEASIDKAAAAGLAVGVRGVRFQPDHPVTRAQMATFLGRTLQAIVDQGVVEDSPATLRAASALETFAGCEDLLGHLKERGLAQVGPIGWSYGGWFSIGAPDSPASGGGDGDTASPRPAPGGGENGFGTPTNTQEKDVDEADVVKTDGRTVWSVLRGRLRAVDVSGETPREVGVLRLPDAFRDELLVHGTRGLVVSAGYTGGDVQAASHPGAWRPVSTLTWVDLSDPAAMRVEGTLQVDGAMLAARMVDGVARIAVRSEAPDLGFVFPVDSEPASIAEAARLNRLAVERSEIVQWLPTYRLEDRRAGQERTVEGALYGCDGLRRPPEFSGLGSLNVLTADLAGPPSTGRATGVLAGGDLVYASTGNLYVATARWDRLGPGGADPEGMSTEVHAFSLADRTTARYAASGEVEGVLLNQFAMSEHAGHLRVASTTAPRWWADDTSSESFVTVLAPQGGALSTVGRVGGLGRGERIRGVRFEGEQGYVVTFRQTDPLYTLDLRDPTAPRVVGELKVLGYSAYLHRVGDGLLLGVGQDADEQGMTSGTQLSLFDVSDPANPTRLHALPLGDGTSTEVEFDHRAFLYEPVSGTAVLPIQRYSFEGDRHTSELFLGAVGVAVDASAGLTRLAELSHGAPSNDGHDRWPGIRRSLVVGDTVYTLSDLGLKGSDLATFEDRSFVAFAE